HVDRAAATASAFSAPWQEYVTANAWGAVWTRPGLDRRTRSMLTVALLSALGHHHELAMHVRAAIRTGGTAAEPRQGLLHTAADHSAFGVTQQVLADLGVPEAVTPPGAT